MTENGIPNAIDTPNMFDRIVNGFELGVAIYRAADLEADRVHQQQALGRVGGPSSSLLLPGLLIVGAIVAIYAFSD